MVISFVKAKGKRQKNSDLLLHLGGVRSSSGVGPP
jgi:hypothetical protein